MYHIDGGGSFSAAEWIEAESDEAALEAARAISTSIAREIWKGRRFVGRVETPRNGVEES